MTYDFAIVGGGIVGLATAAEILRQYPNARIAVFEKEDRWAAHQSGRNSGVIHSGIYYKPGSLKARLGREGNRSMADFAREHGIAHQICGKLIVATSEEERPRLAALFERGRQNGIDVKQISPDDARQIEPFVECLEALYVPRTGIIDYAGVCATLAAAIKRGGGELHLSTRIDAIARAGRNRRLSTSGGDFECAFLISCAGLQSDRVAKMDAAKPGAQIVPFRGEYYEIVPERRDLVRGLIYPVPDPRFPFLGVHLTRTIDGGVHAGPNAVLAFAREGYGKFQVSAKDMLEVVTYGGFWTLAAKFWREGAAEMLRSLSKGRFTRSLQALVPSIKASDLVVSTPGVRAQAIAPDGSLIDDFLIVRGEGSLHVCNAPSPAATASLEIAKEIVGRI